MANYNGVRRVSDPQFDTLAAGGTVSGESYDSSMDYETPVYETEIGDGLVVENDVLKTDNDAIITDGLVTNPPTLSSAQKSTACGTIGAQVAVTIRRVG